MGINNSNYIFNVKDKLKNIYYGHSIGLKNISNARDIGGYKTNDGKTVKKNLLIRSAALTNASKEDIDILENKLKIRTIIDLRADYEINLDKNKNINNVKYYNISTVKTDGNHEKLIKIFQNMMQDSSNIISNYNELEKTLKHSNLDLIENEYTINKYHEAFNIILNSVGAILFHCTSGKDRTGILSFLILAALGVDKETIIDDYEASNVPYENFCNNAQKILLQNGLNENDVKNVISIIGVNRSAIENDFDIIEKKYGGINNYLHNQIRLNDEEINLLKEKYLE